jgi:serine phosphatase RsbU (regulator of sigma subunit)
MNALLELTGIIEDLNQAGSFKDAAQQLTEWARGFTGCQAAMLRLLQETGEGPWLVGCALDGPSASFARDETVVGGSDCICGRVATGAADPSLPFYTAGGSFHWGRMGTLEKHFSPEQVGPLRGRCLEERYQSLAVFPLRAGGRVVGSLHLADARPDRFSDSVEVVESACRLAGGILVRYRAQEREHAALEAVQAALLPATPPAVEGMSIGVSFDPTTELARLGGDFYDVLDLGRTGVLVLVGDAAGKGLEAVGMAARARYAMEAHANLASHPASFLSTTNDSLLRLLPPERFVTAAACLVDRKSGSVTTCLAGHPSPLKLVSTDGPEGAGVAIEAPHNPPLGLFAGLRFAEATERVAPGDVLLIYTDGVSDSQRGKTRLGAEGIARVAGLLRHQDPKHIARNLCAIAADYHDPSLPTDDRLVVAVRLDKLQKD